MFATCPDAPHLRVVYRSHGGENGKGRPEYYSKRLALASFLRATEGLTPAPELIFLNDGPIPADRLELMQASGEVVPLYAGSNRRSYRAAIALATRRDGGDNDLTWFAEDDYLYTSDALRHLAAAAVARPDADYFTMLGSESADTRSPRNRPTPRPEPGAEGDPHATTIAGVAWFRALSTTSTFGVRQRVLREDANLLRTCPFAGADWDYATCLVYQGLLPFTAAEVLADLFPVEGMPSARLRSMARGMARTGIALRAFRRPTRRRVLIGPDPELISHMELPEPDPRTPPSARTLAVDWPGVAAEAAAWVARRSDRSRPGTTAADDQPGDRIPQS
ncbi:MAG: hypothetical protein ACRDRH_03365 [Pseudonocardia sp.]